MWFREKLNTDGIDSDTVSPPPLFLSTSFLLYYQISRYLSPILSSSLLLIILRSGVRQSSVANYVMSIHACTERSGAPIFIEYLPRGKGRFCRSPWERQGLEMWKYSSTKRWRSVMLQCLILFINQYISKTSLVAGLVILMAEGCVRSSSVLTADWGRHWFSQCSFDRMRWAVGSRNMILTMLFEPRPQDRINFVTLVPCSWSRWRQSDVGRNQKCRYGALNYYFSEAHILFIFGPFMRAVKSRHVFILSSVLTLFLSSKRNTFFFFL